MNRSDIAVPHIGKNVPIYMLSGTYRFSHWPAFAQVQKARLVSMAHRPCDMD